MKTVVMSILAATLLTGASASAFAAPDNDSPTYQQTMESLWISTGDATYARLAGFTDAQIAATQRPSHR
jgi:hypothetical protein